VTSHATMKARNVNEISAQNLAEAAMQHAMWVCRENNGVCADDLTFSIDGTTAAINVTEQPPAGSKVYQIQVVVNYPDL